MRRFTPPSYETARVRASGGTRRHTTMQCTRSGKRTENGRILRAISRSTVRRERAVIARERGCRHGHTRERERAVWCRNQSVIISHQPRHAASILSARWRPALTHCYAAHMRWSTAAMCLR
jgi:hypothetical protein